MLKELVVPKALQKNAHNFFYQFRKVRCPHSDGRTFIYLPNSISKNLILPEEKFELHKENF